MSNNRSNAMAPGSSSEELSPLQRAALIIKDLQSKLETSRQAINEPIAIVGMSCRFPESKNLNEYWSLLVEGRNAVKETPQERWDLEQWYDPNPAVDGKISTKYGGYIDDVDAFDASFFGIPASEARRMDPGQRIMLQQVWHALEHAGIPALSLRGSDTGFFVGMSQNDYGSLQINGASEDITTYSGTGNGYCFASGRISYQYGFQGPTMTTDTACSSSLVALHQAVQALRVGDSRIALAAGVQLNLTPPMQVFFSRTQSFSPDGRCYTFDHRANGFILGEGIGVVVLMKLRDAIADHRTIHAIIRGTGVNHGGAAPGLTVPSESAQEILLKQSLKRAQIHPDSIDYIETHGTGTNLGDPIEIGAIRSAYGSRSDAQPLFLGSVKTNIGHLNAAAGMAGLIKTVMMLKKQIIVPNLHFEVPNPRINWDGFNAIVPTTTKEWVKTQEELRRASVSSFGLSGTNAHVLLEEYQTTRPVEDSKTDVEKDRESISESYPGNSFQQTSVNKIFTFSARNEQALHRLINEHWSYLSTHGSEISLHHYSYTLNAGRSALNHRCCIIAHSVDELAEVLQLFLSRKQDQRWSYQVTDRKEFKKGLTNDVFDLEEVREWYLSGGLINWETYYHSEDKVILDLPTYPFAEDRYWLTDLEEYARPEKKSSNGSPQNDSSITERTERELTTSASEHFSLASILNMQLELAAKTLNQVSAMQLSSLHQHWQNTTDFNGNGLSITATESDGQTINQESHISISRIDTCGTWSLICTSIEKERSDTEVKEQLIETLKASPEWTSSDLKDKPASGLSGKILALSSNDPSDAIAALRDEKGKRIFIADIPTDPGALIFMFPGVGDHYVHMAKGLFERDPGFRAVVEYCCSKMDHLFETPLLEILYPSTTNKMGSEQKQGSTTGMNFKAMLGRDVSIQPEQERMNLTRHSQTLVFIIEYAMARFWQGRGFQPDALIGYSIGEYVAAVLAGVMSLDDALELVSRRAMLIEKLPPGALLAVPLDEHSLRSHLSDLNLFVAINSTPTLTVVGGDASSIDMLADRLKDQEVVCRKLQGTHAFHTPMLKELDADLRALVGSFHLRAPSIPIVSTVTGTWMKPEDATDPAYWARHTWQSVRFAQGMSELLDLDQLQKKTRRVFLEVGPGVSLGSFMIQHPDAKKVPHKINLASIKTMYERTADEPFVLNTQAKLILAGCNPRNLKD